MENKIETIEYKGYEIETFYDQDAMSPNEWDNEDVFIVHDHRQFDVRREGFNPNNLFENMQENKKLYDGYWIFPLYAYIHSGVSLSLGRNAYPFNDRWDVSFSGFVLVKRQKNWSWKEDQAYKIAESKVDLWNLYLSEQVYGYTSEVGGCWGFYGDEGEKQMIEEAKNEIDYEIKKKQTNHFNKLKVLIRNKVPYENRPILELV